MGQVNSSVQKALIESLLARLEGFLAIILLEEPVILSVLTDLKYQIIPCMYRSSGGSSIRHLMKLKKK